jgi:integral membrane protein (TIGR01906 family)
MPKLRELKKKFKQKLRKQIAYIWAISVLIIVLILLSNVLFMFYNNSFFYSEYQKLSVYNTIPREEAKSATESMLSYLTGESDQLSSFYNQKEKQHLKDVKALVFYDKVVIFIIWLTIILLSSLFYKKLKLTSAKDFTKHLLKKLGDILILQGILMAALLLISFLLRKAFNFFFIMFHKLLFSNDLWLLDPNTDKLIVLLPEQFFIHTTAAILIRSLAVCTILLLIGLVISRISKNK